MGKVDWLGRRLVQEELVPALIYKISMMKAKKILIPIVILTIIFMIFRLSYSQKSTLLTQHDKYHEYFKDTFFNKFRYGVGIGSPNDTLCSYLINDDYNVIIWQIGKYNDLNLGEIKIEKSSIGDFSINFYENNVTPSLSIKSKENSNGDVFRIFLDNDTKIQGSFTNNTDLFINTKKIAFGNSNKKMSVIFDFHEQFHEVDLKIRKINGQFFLFMLYNFNSQFLQKIRLESMMKTVS